jgi:hypothetical protein
MTSIYKILNKLFKAYIEKLLLLEPNLLIIANFLSGQSFPMVIKFIPLSLKIIDT